MVLPQGKHSLPCYGFTNSWYTDDETKHIASAIQNPLHGDLWLERDFVFGILNSDANAQDFESSDTFWNLVLDIIRLQLLLDCN